MNSIRTETQPRKESTDRFGDTITRWWPVGVALAGGIFFYGALYQQVTTIATEVHNLSDKVNSVALTVAATHQSSEDIRDRVKVLEQRH